MSRHASLTTVAAISLAVLGQPAQAQDKRSAQELADRRANEQDVPDDNQDASRRRLEEAVRKYSEALTDARRRAEQGDTEGHYILAVLLEPFWRAAVLMSLEFYSPQARAKLEDDDFVLEDDVEAVRLYRLAVEQGHEDEKALAQFGLGVMYWGGRGVLKDQVLAHMWLNIASANGDAAARTARDGLEGDMTRAEIARATDLARACKASNYQDCEP